MFFDVWLLHNSITRLILSAFPSHPLRRHPPPTPGSLPPSHTHAPNWINIIITSFVLRSENNRLGRSLFNIMLFLVFATIAIKFQVALIWWLTLLYIQNTLNNMDISSWFRIFYGGGTNFFFAWGGKFLARNWNFWIFPGGADPGPHYVSFFNIFFV